MSETFTYSYSAKENEEVKQIREKYISINQPETNIEKIRKLDKKAYKRGTIISLITGIVSSLILGTGMCLVMLWSMLIAGIVIGIAGISGMIISYPLYKRIISEDKEKIKDEILKLCEKEIKD